MPLWLDARPLLLASKSETRRKILQAAGLPVEVKAADINERALEAQGKVTAPGDVAAMLARAKAQTVAAAVPGRLVLGADQTLALGDRRLSKPASRAVAREQLRALSGKTHELHSALALMRGGELLFEHAGLARLTMRPLTDGFLDRYLDTAGEAATTSVGAYQLEGPGIHLFERVEGDYFTILGLPLLPLLSFLRGNGSIAG